VRNRPFADGLPPGWHTSPLGRLVDIRLGKMLQPSPASASDSLVPYLNAKTVRWDRVDVGALPEMWASPRDLEVYSVQTGDLLVCEGGQVGRSSVLESAPEKTIVQNSVHRLRARSGVSLGYVRYALYALDDSGWFDVLCNRATIAHLTREKLASLRVPSPPLENQHRIADFLDRETEKIDALVTKKQRLIELLQEQRTALISHAVTKGLDPDVPMKESGAWAVDQVPRHWQTPNLSLCCSLLTDGTHAPPAWAPGDCRLLSARNIVAGEFVVRDDDRTMSEEDARMMPASCIVRRGDVLLTIVGATTGKTAVAGEVCDVAVQRSLAIIRPRESMAEPDYLHLWLQSHLVQQSIRRIVNQYSAQPGIYLQDVGALPTALPPLDEQREILTRVHPELSRVKSLTSAIWTQVTRMQEYCSALITAAVTGQIDVRAYRGEAS